MNAHPVNGTLSPTGGGDMIPLIRPVLTVGRRESCDICLRFPNISGMHCELQFRDGYWYVRDLNSTNGVKVNGLRVQEKMLRPGDEVGIGKRRFTITYDFPSTHDALDENDIGDVMGQSLLEKAGLERPRPDHRKRAFDPADFLLEEDQ